MSSSSCFLLVEFVVFVVSKGQNQALKVSREGGAAGLSWG